MINRTMMRSRVLQVLYAYYMNDSISSKEGLRMISRSFENTYKLYVLLLCLVAEVTEHASDQVRAAEERASIVHREYIANRKFIENRFTHQLLNNLSLIRLLDVYHLDWGLGINAIRSIYRDMVESDFYREYLADASGSYQQDKKLWINVFTHVVLHNDVLLSVLEELEVRMNAFNLVSDLGVVVSYVVKTIRSFRRENGIDQDLLGLYDGSEDIEFANGLFLSSVRGREEYERYINDHLINWDADRISFIDRLIIQQALAEIFTFDDIEVEVTFNEYIELAKEFSGERNYVFVNGILNEIINEIKDAQNLPKVLLMKMMKNK